MQTNPINKTNMAVTGIGLTSQKLDTDKSQTKHERKKTTIVTNVCMEIV